MLMTHIAILDAGEPQPSLLECIGRRLARFFGLAEAEDESDARRLPHDTTALLVEPIPPVAPTLHLVSMDQDTQDTSEHPGLRWRRHPQLLNHSSTGLPQDEREARQEAVRGLFAARAGALGCAEQHFARAARLSEIDLTAVPGFWNLDRTAMLVAVDAYEHVGRIRDAAALNARIRSMYRPRALSPVPQNVVQLPPSSTKVSTSS